ncbi:unnamed protein product [Onchocerca flexuosa]|uniref:PHD-type domain-containing protein n=1 Tax=Onchocerca flexuosa TaxID=387005 RepID=A0A183I1X6_9BILA|nr:unnamed protein product [Onchocerca flexuosa]
MIDNKFSAAATPADAHDEDEIFEGVDAEINPIIDEKNEEFCFSRKVHNIEACSIAFCVTENRSVQMGNILTQNCKRSQILQFSCPVIFRLFTMKERPSLTSVSLTTDFLAFANGLSRQKSPIKAKKIPQSSSTSSKSDSTSKSKISSPEISQGIVSTVAVKKRESRSKDSVSISSSESKTDKIKRIESGSKTVKDKAKQDMNERKKKDKVKKKKKKTEEKSVERKEFKTSQKKMEVIKDHKKKENIKDVKKSKGKGYEIEKSKEKKLENGKVLHAKTVREELVLQSCGIESKKATETSGKYELKSETLSNKPLIETASSLANIPLEQSPQSISNIDLLPIEMMKKDQLLYEKMEDDIVLDTNVLQSLATDLTTQSNKVNKDVIGEDIAKKLIEIEKKDQSSTEQDHIKEEKEIVISEIARKIVEALTSNHVLGKVLTPEEAAILKDYFSQKIPLSEKDSELSFWGSFPMPDLHLSPFDWVASFCLTMDWRLL